MSDEQENDGTWSGLKKTIIGTLATVVTAADLKERARFGDYMEAYEEAINETSKEHAPWFVVPADKKWFARVAAIQIIIETLEKMNLQYPELPKEEKEDLDEAKRQLESE